MGEWFLELQYDLSLFIKGKIKPTQNSDSKSSSLGLLYCFLILGSSKGSSGVRCTVYKVPNSVGVFSILFPIVGEILAMLGRVPPFAPFTFTSLPTVKLNFEVIERPLQSSHRPRVLCFSLLTPTSNWGIGGGEKTGTGRANVSYRLP